ncbi:response regulator [Parasphingorhabdus cellanae]|uniref:Response regulator n=1 Tax=Parasphingorhabdus cellanae TaxID=2806553 RepID=A0ABX7T3V6_9SPHN|nr:response regulator [Parasphingorhabdus cellanae]QTD56221.1 response regulator [Parasphingorhabdus cellanae]
MAQILIADDDALIGEVIFHRLQDKGHNVVVVDDGGRVVEQTLQTKPEIIILDNLMPGLTGTEILSELQRNAFTATIPVIMLTAQTGRNQMIEAYRAGASDYMTKPFDPEELIDRVAGVIGPSVGNSDLEQPAL